MLQIFKKFNVIPNFPTMKTNSNCLLFNHNQLNLLLPYGGNTHLTTQYYNDNSHLPTMSYSDSIGLSLTLPPTPPLTTLDFVFKILWTIKYKTTTTKNSYKIILNVLNGPSVLHKSLFYPHIHYSHPKLLWIALHCYR
jgi:hypothetical protein